MAEGKGCHGGETEMVPRQHPGSGNSIGMLVQRNKCGCAKRARVTGSDPGYRVSHMSVAWLTANVQGTIRTRCKHRVHLIQHMHSVHGRRLGVIPSKRAFSERFESSREVVVHGDGRGTRDLGNGSRTCPERNLSHPRYSGVVEVVVRAPVDELDGSHE